MPPALVLASGSPRRRELLALLGGTFEARPSTIDEEASASPARDKAHVAAAPGRTTIAADTRILLDGEWIGKPGDAADAIAILQRLAGRTHEVVTDVTVIDGAGREMSFAVSSRVTMRAFDRAEAEAYVATGEPLDAAGAYMTQGGGGAFVEGVDGCYANVVGFPLCHAYEALRLAGRSFPERPDRVCQRHFAFACPVWRHAQAQGRALRDGARYASWIDAR